MSNQYRIEITLYYNDIRTTLNIFNTILNHQVVKQLKLTFRNDISLLSVLFGWFH